jgi:hypothetical protein
MNTVINSSSVMNSFKVLWQWLMAKPGQPLPTVSWPGTLSHGADASVKANASTLCKPAHNPQNGNNTTSTIRPVRVLQVLELGQSPAQSGRLRISGRMADVCAELDRLAAREALQH